MKHLFDKVRWQQKRIAYTVVVLVSALLMPKFAIFAAPVEIYRPPKPVFVPGDNKTLLIIGQGHRQMRDYVQSTGKIPGGFMSYTSIQKANGLTSLCPETEGGHYAQYWIDHYPDTALNLGLYMVGALDDTLAGRYDKNLKVIGDWLKKANRPVYLRIGYECDLPENGYSPDKYKKAFRYIVRKLKRNGVKNVNYVWHVHNTVRSTEIAGQYYPGDDVVDIVAISFFATGQVGPGRRFATFARQHHKPLMIAEASPMGFYSTKNKVRWFETLIRFIEKEDVKIFSYINVDWDATVMFRNMKFGDSRIQGDPELETIWNALLDKPRYVVSTSQLFKTLSFRKQR